MTRKEVIKALDTILHKKTIAPLDRKEALEEAIEYLKHDKQHMSLQRQRMKELKEEIKRLKRDGKQLPEQTTAGDL